MTVEKENVVKKRKSGRRLLVFGVTCLISAIAYFLPDLLTTKHSLLQIKGSVIYSDLVIDEVFNRNRIGIESKSRRATLVFILDGQSRLFRLVENIGKDYNHIEYKKLLERLRGSKQVVVWIKSSDEKLHEPKIFQIDIDNQTDFDFATVKYENIWIFLLLISFGLFCILIVLYKEYPKKLQVFRS
jgi:hypothetical protein